MIDVEENVVPCLGSVVSLNVSQKRTEMRLQAPNLRLQLGVAAHDQPVWDVYIMYCLYVANLSICT